MIEDGIDRIIEEMTVEVTSRRKRKGSLWQTETGWQSKIKCATEVVREIECRESANKIMNQEFEIRSLLEALIMR